MTFNIFGLILISLLGVSIFVFTFSRSLKAFKMHLFKRKFLNRIEKDK